MERYWNWDKKDDCIHRPLKKVLFLECGNKPQDITFQIENSTVLPGQSYVLDRLFIDTKKLCKPLIKFEFSSLVQFEATFTEETSTVTANLQFTLARICNGVTEVLQTWDYVNSVTPVNSQLAVASTEPFTVTYCDKPCACDQNVGCCEYRMVVSGIAFSGAFTSLRVIRPDLSAFVQSVIEA